MVSISDLKLVAATHEVTADGFIYRIHSGEGGVIVRRVKLEPGEVTQWSHGTLVYVYDANIEAFSPQCIATIKKFASIEEAIAVIANYNIEDFYNDEI